MKLSLNWLKDLVKIPFDVETLVQKLTFSGLEVESVTSQIPNFDKNIVIGFVKESANHPDSDHLSLCQVDVGNEVLQIVCGASNVKKGQKVPVALIGAELPNGIKMKKTKIRGQESNGMICSKSELGLAETSDGIFVLEEHAEIGKPFLSCFKDSDTTIEISVLPNRPDALGHFGVAREISALQNQKIEKPKIELSEIEKQTKDEIVVEIDFPEACPRYSAKIIEGIKVAPSPAWLVKRLETIGLRSINNVVDVTNYVMFELGQPMHAFDFSEIKGNKIVVGKSQKGQKFTTLDGNQRELDESTILICDAEKIIALGGVMGGLNSEVKDETTKILLESAYFTPSFIRKTSTKLGLKSDASHRFERGTDPNSTLYALERAAQLLAEIANGKVYAGNVDVYPKPILPKEIELRPERIEKVLGISIPQEKVEKALANLGISKVAENIFLAPTFRPDLEREIDLIEELVRMIGYDALPLKKTSQVDFSSASVRNNFKSDFRKFLAGLGLNEILTNSMTTVEIAQKFKENNEAIILANPLNREFAALRTSLFPGFLEVLRINLFKKSTTSFRFFEVGTVFWRDENVYNKAKETQRGILLFAGNRKNPDLFCQNEEFDFYDAKGFAEVVTEFSGFKQIRFKTGTRPYFTENCLEVIGNGRTIGFVGEVSEKVLKDFDVSCKNVLVFEFDFEIFEKTYSVVSKLSPLNKFPFVERDFAFTLEKSVQVGELVQKIEASKVKNLVSINVFDLYEGKPLTENQKSVALNFRFESFERTLTDEEVSEAMGKILKISEENFGAELRK
ncbi:phenylalanine--tRNA ligase subunit beta [bacterium]|nr:phenylalanine--tRNA ligase subunit beta [bacterium]